MTPADLELRVDRVLRQLPQPRAPRTLVPRVLAAAEAWHGRPWYRRPWSGWPVVWQVASAVVVLGCIVALGVAAVAAGRDPASGLLQSTGIVAAWDRLAGLISSGLALVSALVALGAMVLRAILGLGLLVPVAAVLAIMVSACMAVILALDHLVTGKAFRS